MKLMDCSFQELNIFICPFVLSIVDFFGDKNVAIFYRAISQIIENLKAGRRPIALNKYRLRFL